MKKSNVLISVLAVLVAVGIVANVSAESKYSASASAATAVTFKAKDNGWNVTAVMSKGGTADSEIKVYGRAQETLDVQAVTARATTTCTVVNTSLAINTNDLVIYQSVNGTAEYRTATTGTTSNKIVLSSAPSTTYATGDKIYELGQIAAVQLGVTTNANGKYVVNETGASVARTPSDSPLYVVTGSTTNNQLTVTAD